jgi:hypothetical protein
MQDVRDTFRQTAGGIMKRGAPVAVQDMITDWISVWLVRNYPVVYRVSSNRPVVQPTPNSVPDMEQKVILQMKAWADVEGADELDDDEFAAIFSAPLEGLGGDIIDTMRTIRHNVAIALISTGTAAARAVVLSRALVPNIKDPNELLSLRLRRHFNRLLTRMGRQYGISIPEDLRQELTDKLCTEPTEDPELPCQEVTKLCEWLDNARQMKATLQRAEALVPVPQEPALESMDPVPELEDLLNDESDAGDDGTEVPFCRPDMMFTDHPGDHMVAVVGYQHKEEKQILNDAEAERIAPANSSAPERAVAVAELRAADLEITTAPEPSNDISRVVAAVLEVLAGPKAVLESSSTAGKLISCNLGCLTPLAPVDPVAPVYTKPTRSSSPPKEGGGAVKAAVKSQPKKPKQSQPPQAAAAVPKGKTDEAKANIKAKRQKKAAAKRAAKLELPPADIVEIPVTPETPAQPASRPDAEAAPPQASLEGMVGPQLSMNVPSFVACVAMANTDVSDFWKSGMLTRDSASGVVQFRTHQHVDESHTSELPEQVHLRIHPFSALYPVEVKLVGSLPVWWDTQVYTVHGLPEFVVNHIGPLTLAQPKLGEGLMMVSWSGKHWKLNSGTVRCFKTDMTGGTVVYYDLNTEKGDCRLPIFNRKGQIVGSHRYGNINVEGITLNGGEVDVPGAVRKLAPPPDSRESFLAHHKGTAELPATLQGGNLPPALAAVEQYTTKSRSLEVNLPKTGQKLPRAPGSFDAKWWPMKPHEYLPDWEIKHVVGKPTMSAVANEVSKFNLELGPWGFPEDETLAAFRYVAEDDLNTSIPAPDMTDRSAVFSRFADVISGLNPTSSPGLCEFSTSDGQSFYGPDYDSQHSLVEAMGGGCFDTGCSYLASAMTNFVQLIMSCESPSELGTEVLWKVQGKMDKYKATSVLIDKVRSIQAPPLHYKLVWMFLMWHSDQDWVHDPTSDNYTGIPVNCPLPHKLESRLDKAYGATSTDITGFDRNMHEVLMRMFFYVYVPIMAPGAAIPLLAYLASAAIDSRLVMPDGVVYIKEHGNPSGFPNTIRLNCVTHKATNLLCKMYALRQVVSESAPSALAHFLQKTTKQQIQAVEKITRSLYCGDDGLNTALNEHGMRVLRLSPSYWKKTPWVVKEEGDHVFDRTGDIPDYYNCPSFISRTPVRLFGSWYHRLDKPEKVVSKLVYGPVIDNTFQERLDGIEQGLVFGMVEHVMDRLRGGPGTSRVYDWMDANFGSFSVLAFYVETLVQDQRQTTLRRRKKKESPPRDKKVASG